MAGDPEVTASESAEEIEMCVARRNIKAAPRAITGRPFDPAPSTDCINER
jgi:hypothetical protein